MLPTFVIGLREGLEAALIVGIIAAFLRKQGRRDLLRQMAAGVFVAVLLCVAVGIGLELLSRSLPQRQQEGLETVVGLLAVAMVTYMVVWMKRHSRGLKSQLEGQAADALTSGRGRAGLAMVAMAFLAVLREGFETVVFLLAAFNESSSGAAVFGAVIGITLAVGLGYGIYRGGVRINLSKFFRATGLVLVLVAAGLLVTALHTAHEAGWLNLGQTRTVNLSWLVAPGSVRSSLLTGILGMQPHPVVIEVVGWLVYLVPVGLFVAWPPGRSLSRRAALATLSGLAAASLVSGIVLFAVAPPRPEADPVTSAGQISARVSSMSSTHASIHAQNPWPAPAQPVAVDLTLQHTGTLSRQGTSFERYGATMPQAVTGRPDTLPITEVARLNGGRLPLGVVPGSSRAVPVGYPATRELSVVIEPRTHRVVDVRWSQTVRVSAIDASGNAVTLARPAESRTRTLPATAVSLETSRAAHDVAQLDRRSGLLAGAWLVLAIAVAAAAGALACQRRGRRSGPPRRSATAVHGHAGTLTKS